MEGADIADIYYPAFLINGKQNVEYPDLKPGEKVRLRIIDGAASTSFWMTFGGETPTLVSADGNDVVPVKRNKTFIGVAETYDFIVTIPQDGKLEFRIMAQDGSGSASASLGSGEILKAKVLERPDKIGMMQKMAKMHMKMGAPALKYRPHQDERFKMKEEYGMHMDEKEMGEMKMDSNMKADSMSKKHSAMKDSEMDMKKDTMQVDHSQMDHSQMDHSKIKMEKDSMQMDDSKMDTQGMDMFSEYNYNYLKYPEKTTYDKDLPVKNILLNLTGNMLRYVWSLNGVPLAESDKIKIKQGEVTRITFNNLTMMHHPMHLHGHFFRVINENGEYSPLKHTVNVPSYAANDH